MFSGLEASSLLSFPTFQDLPVMESMQMALENVVISIFDGSNEFAGGSSEVHLDLCRMFEGLLTIFSYSIRGFRFIIQYLLNNSIYCKLKVYFGNFFL